MATPPSPLHRQPVKATKTCSLATLCAEVGDYLDQIVQACPAHVDPESKESDTEKLTENARSLAKITSAMIGCLQGVSPVPGEVATFKIFLGKIKKIRAEVFSVIGSCKSRVANPYDYLTAQSLTNVARDLIDSVNSTKDFIRQQANPAAAQEGAKQEKISTFSACLSVVKGIDNSADISRTNMKDIAKSLTSLYADVVRLAVPESLRSVFKDDCANLLRLSNQALRRACPESLADLRVQKEKIISTITLMEKAVNATVKGSDSDAAADLGATNIAPNTSGSDTENSLLVPPRSALSTSPSVLEDPPAVPLLDREMSKRSLKALMSVSNSIITDSSISEFEDVPFSEIEAVSAEQAEPDEPVPTVVTNLVSVFSAQFPAVEKELADMSAEARREFFNLVLQTHSDMDAVSTSQGRRKSSFLPENLNLKFKRERSVMKINDWMANTTVDSDPPDVCVEDLRVSLAENISAMTECMLQLLKRSFSKMSFDSDLWSSECQFLYDHQKSLSFLLRAICVSLVDVVQKESGSRGSDDSANENPVGCNWGAITEIVRKLFTNCYPCITRLSEPMEPDDHMLKSLEEESGGMVSQVLAHLVSLIVVYTNNVRALCAYTLWSIKSMIDSRNSNINSFPTAIGLDSQFLGRMVTLSTTVRSLATEAAKLLGTVETYRKLSEQVDKNRSGGKGMMLALPNSVMAEHHAGLIRSTASTPDLFAKKTPTGSRKLTGMPVAFSTPPPTKRQATEDECDFLEFLRTTQDDKKSLGGSVDQATGSGAPARRGTKSEDGHKKVRALTKTYSIVDIVDHFVDENIWEEKSHSKKGQFDWQEGEKAAGSLKKGTLNRLVRYLTSDLCHDNNYLWSFITTYRSFTTPWKLFEKLVQRYHVPEGTIEPKRMQSVKLRVAVVMKAWCDSQFEDFDEDLIPHLFEFAAVLRRDGFNDISLRLRKSLVQKSNRRKIEKSAVLSSPLLNIWCFEVIKLSPIEQLLVSSSREIARQLTLIDFEIYAQVKPPELLNQSWNQPKYRHRAQNLLRLIHRLNQLSYYVASSILSSVTSKERAVVVCKFLKIIRHLRKINSFNSMMGVLAGINMSSIRRLKATFSLIPPKYVAVLTSAEDLLSPQQSFKNYRRQLRQVLPPVVPYIGVYLTDLVFVDDGNPDNIKSTKKPDSPEFINFAKRRMIYKVIQEVLLYQQNPFQFARLEPLHTMLLRIPCPDDDKELYPLSIALEPKQSLAAVSAILSEGPVRKATNA